ncbi:retinol dehydrogenase 12 [Aplochiton taeniatus]
METLRSLIFKKWSSSSRLDGKTAIVTGANTGIGKEIARDLAKRGARVILACRDMEKAEQAVSDIASDCEGAKVVACNLDLANTKSICQFAESIYNTEKLLHLLINNAGVAICPYQTTADGYEMQFGVNHLGHFFLTFLLLDLLKHSAPTRVITVSSVAHTMGKIRFDDLSGEKDYHSVRAYAQSKLANVLFTRELAKRTEALGVTAYAVDPGLVQTDLMRHMMRPLQKAIRRFGFLVKSPAEGAYTILHCAVAPDSELVTGGYYRDCAEAACSRAGLDDGTALKLWIVSCHLLGIQEKQVNILINNAGIMMCPQSKTADGFEMQLGVNHLGHFLLTYLLLDLLKRSTPSRIVNVASVAHTWSGIRLDDINSERGYDPIKAYGQSKLANVLSTRSLAKRLQGTGLSVFSLHPGVVQSDLWRHLNPCVQVAVKVFRIFTKTTVEGAQTTIYCSVEPGLESQSGGYFSDCAPARCSRDGSDDDLAQKLWEASCTMLGITWE